MQSSNRLLMRCFKTEPMGYLELGGFKIIKSTVFLLQRKRPRLREVKRVLPRSHSWRGAEQGQGFQSTDSQAHVFCLYTLILIPQSLHFKNPSLYSHKYGKGFCCMKPGGASSGMYPHQDEAVSLVFLSWSVQVGVWWGGGVESWPILLR